MLRSQQQILIKTRIKIQMNLIEKQQIFLLVVVQKATAYVSLIKYGCGL